MSTSIRYLRLFMHIPTGERRAMGYLSQYGDILRLSFDESYIQDARRPTLSMSLRGVDDASTQQILRATRDERLVRNDGRWPVFFQNLLPEGHNRERLAAQRGCTTEDEFELLAAAGHDLMGALEVEPVPADEAIPHVVRHWHAALGLDVLEPGFVELPVEDAASLPGMVTKFSAVQEGRRYVVQRHGVVGSHILKLPSTRHPDLVENEATGYRLCGALGLDCARATVITREQAQLPEPVEFPHILAVERFDRRHGLRVHMEEFAQVLGYAPRHKYGKGIERDFGQMLRLLNRYSTQPARDTREFLGRLVAFILMGNTDAHLKNWALMYPDGVEPQLAPLYDPVCVSAFFAGLPPTDYGVNRAIDRTQRAFTWAQLEALIESAGLLRKGVVLRHCKALVQAAQADWPALLTDAPASVREEVHARLRGGVALTTA
ncbi:type II toxin-antitoxin system HipA family toxin [Hydrogenophaga sp. BPS33]|uniref:type II toxin-antitoxin system HipA family toxin n=1 Tax=Hydrogenophaga sp. BPS33 TaxID=2651974 RepID=UPI0013200651|nr:HipA domain-containing protein [Hydrogenophaga sp. BPS33]QHE87130.1 type II toxin-antitoxin system HipA family toxin [Hydrogenophaga sp. BPS33]